MAKQIVTLETLGNGVAIELFRHELSKVLTNIMDQNTDARTKRAITLKATFSPFKDRSGAEVMVDCSAKLAPIPSQVAGNVFLHKDDGELQAYTADARQADFFEQRSEAPAEQPNVVRMASAK